MQPPLGVPEDGHDDMAVAEAQDGLRPVPRVAGQLEKEGELDTVSAVRIFLLCCGQVGLHDHRKILEGYGLLHMLLRRGRRPPKRADDYNVGCWQSSCSVLLHSESVIVRTQECPIRLWGCFSHITNTDCGGAAQAVELSAVETPRRDRVCGILGTPF